jgi:hypothetical protein
VSGKKPPGPFEGLFAIVFLPIGLVVMFQAVGYLMQEEPDSARGCLGLLLGFVLLYLYFTFSHEDEF